MYPYLFTKHLWLGWFDTNASNLELEWKTWYLQFTIFLRATNLVAEEDGRKVSLLLHHMGGSVLPIFQSFQCDLSKVKFDELVTKF
ncbi:hypothetical protein WDU94_012192 [Cyamophila willieti]